MLINSKVIAVDFDGTIVHDKYPGIGKPLPFAFETLRLLQQDGHRLVLWTVRSGSTLEDAIAFCQKRGVEFYAVNESYPGEEASGRKLNADIFIDDRNIGGLPQWGEIYHFINGNHSPFPAKKSWMEKLGLK